MSARQDRLNALKQAVIEWADKEIQRMEDEVEFLRSVKDGVSQAGQLSSNVTSQASQLVEDEISAYLRD